MRGATPTSRRGAGAREAGCSPAREGGRADGEYEGEGRGTLPHIETTLEVNHEKTKTQVPI